MTTRQQLAVPVVALLLVACVPRDGLALIGLIEKLSGPGPFKGFQVPLDRIVCVVTPNRPQMTDSEREVLCATDGADEPTQIDAYLTFETTLAWSDTSTTFPAVTFTGLKPLVFFRLHRALDAGIGVGLNRFSGTNFGFTRFSLPVRVRLIPWWEAGSRWRAVYVSLQADYFPEEFTSADFPGSAPGFREEGEIVTAAFLGVDVVRLFGRR
jgi:hypothetical protein